MQTNDKILDALRDLMRVIHANARAKGFWDGGAGRNDGEMIALQHSELSEALEALRHGNPPDKHLPQFKNAVVELADTVIRIFDHAEGRGWPLAEAILAKVLFNATRPHKHGKEF